MTDDLVKRLRDRDAYAKSNGWDNVVFGQAADRIEELQKQLAASDKQIKHLEDEIKNLEYEMCELENRS
jgi:phage shock protein A